MAHLERRTAGRATWLARSGLDPVRALAAHPPRRLEPEVLPDETAVGLAMLEELERMAARRAPEPITVVLLGGRGGQALHRLLGERARQGDPGGLLSRLHVFTQDALAPLPADSPLGFVADFRRLLGSAFFERVAGFTCFDTQARDLVAETGRLARRLDELGGIDLFFVGLGPEPGDASHVCYIRPGSGARATDVSGVIPVAPNLLDHHVAKLRAGGARFDPEDERVCRAATHVLTLGPAAILGARRVVQSIVDADTAPAKRACYARVRATELAEDPAARARQLDANPGLWLRQCRSVRSLVTPSLVDDRA